MISSNLPAARAAWIAKGMTFLKSFGPYALVEFVLPTPCRLLNLHVGGRDDPFPIRSGDQEGESRQRAGRQIILARGK